ncbi:SGNH/GDSL hydrolase family protein [Streptomyces mirabilis]|uniref:SGNH/GDSL hydrolase family protein n=1 Tax=Streptomyces mirabilis TaxID=68239 RepID=UPI0033253A74
MFAALAALVSMFVLPSSGQAAPAGSTYVALGDSFSSGEANAPYLPGTDTSRDQCHRSTSAYPQLLARQGLFYAQPLTDTTAFVACSGADTGSLRNGRYGEPSQLGALGPATTTVTISLGGNDLGFSDLVEACLHVGWNGNPNCKAQKVTSPADGAKITRAQRETWLTDHLDLHSLYQEIHARAPQARIYALLYPHLIAMRGRACHTGPGSYSARNILWFHDMVDYLDQHIADEAAIARGTKADIRVVDPRPAFDQGHTLCGTDSWIHGIEFIQDECKRTEGSTSCLKGSLHPTRAGQQALADAIQQASGASPTLTLASAGRAISPSPPA